MGLSGKAVAARGSPSAAIVSERRQLINLAYRLLGSLAEAEDVWLTMEGSAQWAAYKWVVDPRGGAVPPAP